MCFHLILRRCRWTALFQLRDRVWPHDVLGSCRLSSLRLSKAPDHAYPSVLRISCALKKTQTIWSHDTVLPAHGGLSLAQRCAAFLYQRHPFLKTSLRRPIPSILLIPFTAIIQSRPRPSPSHNLSNSLSTNYQVRTQNFSLGGGGLTLRLYIIYMILKIML
jgi:hypothetical protein